MCRWKQHQLHRQSFSLLVSIHLELSTISLPLLDELIMLSSTLLVEKWDIYTSIVIIRLEDTSDLLPSQGPFPVIHFVYGGPGVQLVRNEWSAYVLFLSLLYFVSQYLKQNEKKVLFSWTFLQKYAALGFAAVVIDGRGSDGRGKKWEGVIKNKLGDVELNDQVEREFRMVN